MKNRLLVIGNILLVPYVWLRFPREARLYTRHCFACLFTGKRY